MKAYCTRVGNGPFPTELQDATGEALRTVGHEFGATTGRPRRCGWFDAVAMRYSAMINGIDRIAVTKLDVLGGFDDHQRLHRVRVERETAPELPRRSNWTGSVRSTRRFPGWGVPLTDCRRYDQLPLNARRYLEALAALTETRLWLVSVGPRRDQTIMLS